MAALFGRRLRRGASTTAVAAVALAALSASQAPAISSLGKDAGRSTGATAPSGDSQPGDSDPSFHGDLPPATSPGTTDMPPNSATVDTGPNASGIPATVLAAYKNAEAQLKQARPGCNLPWQLLAAIGKVESGQARGGDVDANGTTKSPILGPVLDGNGFADIPDTDGGKYDQDPVHDRAVGPMQFIPSTWVEWAHDGNHDGKADPNNIFDAALSAGYKLCADGRDLSVQSQMNAAILGYNQSGAYLDTVLSWYEFYLKGTHSIPDGTGDLPQDPGPGGDQPSIPHLPSGGTLPPSGGGGSQGAPHSGTPSAPPSTPPSAPHDSPPSGGGGTTPPPAKAVVSRLVKTGGDAVSAVVDALFGSHVSVTAEDASGKPVAGVAVTFTITGTTDATFDGGKTSVTVTTAADGTADAPAVRAGDKVGAFKVEASVDAEGVAPADFDASVTAPTADKVVRVGDKVLTAAPGADFADPIDIQATLADKAPGKVAVTATVLNADGTGPAPDGAPAFRAADNSLVTSVTGLVTAADGTLQLPTLVAGKTEGSYVIEITTAGGAKVDVTVQVAAPKDPSSDPSASPSPSAG
jgi:membrane-bound lytic murein transglycosylase B